MLACSEVRSQPQSEQTGGPAHIARHNKKETARGLLFAVDSQRKKWKYSLGHVERVSGMPKSTLNEWRKGVKVGQVPPPPPARPGRTQLLAEAEEKLLCSWLETQAKRGFAVPRGVFNTEVLASLKMLGKATEEQKKMSRDFMKRFFDRHPADLVLGTKTVRPGDLNRLRAINSKTIGEWEAKMKALFSSKKVVRMYTMDETGFCGEWVMTGHNHHTYHSFHSSAFCSGDSSLDKHSEKKEKVIQAFHSSGLHGCTEADIRIIRLGGTGQEP